MAVDTNDVLDLSKENIQPLRQGRKASHLKTALQAQIDPEIQQKLQREREEYEYKIRMYEGNDPLDPYYNYVIWLEQSFPKMGRENNIAQLLEDTLIKFKDNEKYKQDLRLIQLLIKYLEIQSNPLELYQVVHEQGLGTMCALLYKAWAEQYDKVNDIKKADEIYRMGIRCRAQPLDELEKAHVQFQLSVARRMIDGTLNQGAPAESTRTVMSKLKPSSVKGSRISRDGAGVMSAKKAESALTNSNSQVPKFQIYEEDGDHTSQKYLMKKDERFPKGSVSNRENIMQTSKWCGQKFKKSHKIPVTPSTPSFPVHEDPEVACSNVKTDFRPRALKIRRDDFNPPIAVFEPPDPTKKPMYPKQLVYLGGRDVQLEEIRAAHYWKNLNQNSCKNEEDVIEPEKTNEICSQNEICSTEICSTPEVAQIPTKRTEISLTVPQSKSNNWFTPCHHSPSTSMTVNTRAAMNIIQQFWQSPLSEESKKVGTSFGSLSENPGFPIYSETPSIPQDHGQFSVFCDENKPKSVNAFSVYSDDLATPIEKPDLGSYSLQSVKPYNTKPTFEIFHDDDISCNKEDLPVNKPPLKTPSSMLSELGSYSLPSAKSNNTKPTFEVFNDDEASCNKEDPTMNKPPLKTPSSMLRSEDIGDFQFDGFTAASFGKKNETPMLSFHRNYSTGKQFVKINSKNYCSDIDDEEGELARPMGSLHIDREIRGSRNPISTPLPLIIPVNLQDTPLEPENKENQAPKDYASPTERRPLSGILTPAVNIPVQDLRSDDSDLEEGGSRLCARHLDMDEETCTTRAFAVPLPTSTPFSRSRESQSKRTSICERSFIPDENFHTPSELMTARRGPQELQELMENSRKLNFNTPNLSLILENSKELNGFSSGSSGNTGSKYTFL